MDAFGWINLVLLVIVLVGYSYHKGTYNPFKALWDDPSLPMCMRRLPANIV